MDIQQTREFVDAYHIIMLVGAIAMVTLAVIIFLVYHFKVSMIRNLKDKHDFVNASEIKWYKFVRLFFSIAGATLIIYIAKLVLDFYYPTRLNLKLRRFRYTPRTSSTGGKMKLLSEDEEDVHLNEGMQAEENVFSIDYDVWVDEKTSEIKIEKYQGHLISLQCHNCGFYTMRVQREEIIETDEDGSPKELLKHYQCTYCKNVRATQFNVSRKESEDYKHVKPKFKKSTRNIELVKIDVHSSLGAKKTFEFQSLEEARKFLDEFDFDKVA